MSTINHYIANSTSELDNFIEMINDALHKVMPIVEKELRADKIDIIFISAAALAIPEYGLGGNSPGPHHVYVSFDPHSKKITQEGINGTLLHEIHHCMRWRKPGYGETLGEAIVSEGLACLYEEEHSGVVPLYAKATLKNDQLVQAQKMMTSNTYNHSEWFFGTKSIDRWFGYSLGYKMCKEYSQKTGKKASVLVHVPGQDILNSNNI